MADRKEFILITNLRLRSLFFFSIRARIMNSFKAQINNAMPILKWSLEICICGQEQLRINLFWFYADTQHCRCSTITIIIIIKIIIMARWFSTFCIIKMLFQFRIMMCWSKSRQRWSSYANQSGQITVLWQKNNIILIGM